jgi:hypothetical protein
MVSHLRKSHFQYKEKIHSSIATQINILEKTSVDNKQRKTYRG